MSFTADVRDGANEVMPQLLLDLEIPVLVVEIAPVAVNALGTYTFGLSTAQERANRIGEIGHVCRRQRKPARDTLVRIAEVVVLIGAVVDSEARSNHRFSV